MVMERCGRGLRCSPAGSIPSFVGAVRRGRQSFVVRRTRLRRPEAAEHSVCHHHGEDHEVSQWRTRGPDLFAASPIPTPKSLKTRCVPLEAGASEAAVFNSGMAAIMTAFFAFAKLGCSTIVYTTPLIRRHHPRLIHSFLEPFGVRGIEVPSGDAAAIDEAIRSARNCSIVFLETPANPTLIDG